MFCGFKVMHLYKPPPAPPVPVGPICRTCGKPLSDRSGAPPEEPDHTWGFSIDVKDDAGVHHGYCWGAYGARLRRERDNALVARIG